MVELSPDEVRLMREGASCLWVITGSWKPNISSIIRFLEKFRQIRHNHIEKLLFY